MSIILQIEIKLKVEAIRSKAHKRLYLNFFSQVFFPIFEPQQLKSLIKNLLQPQSNQASVANAELIQSQGSPNQARRTTQMPGAISLSGNCSHLNESCSVFSRVTELSQIPFFKVLVSM